MKKIKYLIITIFLFIFNLTFINANEIYSIDVTLELDENGNGIVTEVWDMSVNNGTEVYKPIGDLGNSVISNFKVSDESNAKYFYLSQWNTSGTLSSKAYKIGEWELMEDIPIQLHMKYQT